jgi:hypothetical protein
MTLSGMGQIPGVDTLLAPVQAAVEQSVKLGIERSWPLIEAKTQAMIGAYEKKYMVGAMVIGGLAIIAIGLAIKNQLK